MGACYSCRGDVVVASDLPDRTVKSICGPLVNLSAMSSEAAISKHVTTRHVSLIVNTFEALERAAVLDVSVGHSTGPDESFAKSAMATDTADTGHVLAVAVHAPVDAFLASPKTTITEVCDPSPLAAIPLGSSRVEVKAPVPVSNPQQRDSCWPQTSEKAAQLISSDVGMGSAATAPFQMQIASPPEQVPTSSPPLARKLPVQALQDAPAIGASIKAAVQPVVKKHGKKKRGHRRGHAARK